VQANLFHKDQGGSQTQDVELKKSADSALANAKSKSILGGLARPSSFYNGFFEVENDDIDGENAYCWNFNAV
ncbi:MAG: hypothetical protein U9P37_03470, partial [Pseudomonadota bacterium]|nr:hypothetical protein [Pseudomonadota bacterium]